MAKVTSKLQFTIPRAVAEKHGIEPGDELRVESMGRAIRLVPEKHRSNAELSEEERRRLFDAWQSRVEERIRRWRAEHGEVVVGERDWKREDLYTRGDAG